MTIATIMERYAGRVETQPHKYVVGGKYLIVTPPDRSASARLVFEADTDGTIKRWRVGEPPAVFYVEGCL